ncbi:uncharacterized protein UHOD_11493 [Ustilago sp. UG-2017b]|nr:uncharacterized protein UHOD_11493 [Ustilago sp. UG-2017b]
MQFDFSCPGFESQYNLFFGTIFCPFEGLHKRGRSRGTPSNFFEQDLSRNGRVMAILRFRDGVTGTNQASLLITSTFRHHNSSPDSMTTLSRPQHI